MTIRPRFLGLLFATAAVAAALVLLSADFRLALAVNRARVWAAQPNALHVRLSPPQATLAGRIAEALPRPSSGLESSVGILQLSGTADHDAANRAEGVASIVAGRCAMAAKSFETIRRRNARDWNDLAAAYACAAAEERSPDLQLSALAAADAALAAEPESREARFNRALIVEAFGLAFTSTPTEEASWKAATVDLGALSATELARLTNAYPQFARRYADVYLTAWAVALQRGDDRQAEIQLTAARTIAKTLRQRGDALLAEAIAVLDAASAARRRSIVDGELAYLAGRLSLREGASADAEKHLRTAEALFRRAESPMSANAEFWIASALSEQHRTQEATEILRSLLARGNEFRALTGHVQYQLALIDAVRGNWSKSLTAAKASAAIFESLGERGNVANANALLSENYDLLGQTELAWAHGLASLRDSVRAGALDRARVALAVLCRTELRGGRWSRARALAGLEAELAPKTRDMRLDPDMFLRAAVADWRSGNRTRSRHWLTLARGAALEVAEPATREKLLADVNGVEGALERSADPRKAIGLLSAAIAFQRAAARPIVLPELYLERGHAFTALRELRSAEADFEQGIAELERQRGSVADSELRPGIFENASALFDAAITVQLERGGPIEYVWHWVERGRARAVLEEIYARDEIVRAPAIPRIADVQSALSPGAVVLEYVPLPKRLLVFVITRDAAVLRSIAVGREELSRIADAFVNQRAVNSLRLHEILLAPLRDDLEKAQAINVIVDHTLQRVPFAALFDPKARVFLVERHALASSPSAGVLLETLPRARRLNGGPSPMAMVIANPLIPVEEFGELPSLAGAEREALAIADAYSKTETLRGRAATAERFCDRAPLYDVIHFAGHGVVHEREPAESAIVLAASPHRRGAVTAREIAQLRFTKTRTVVLAACSTMTGRNAAIEGVPSLGRAFLVAGVPGVVGTLWDIEDWRTVSIMRVFHAQLARGATPADALRAAQIDAIRHGLPASQWSAFALMGSAE